MAIMYDGSMSKLLKKQFKKQVKMTRLSKKMKKENRRLHNMNTDLLDTLVELNNTLSSNENDIIQNKAEILSLKNQLELEKKHSLTVSRENHGILKIYIGFISFWSMVFFMYQNRVVDHESFMVMNCCIIMTCIIFSFF